MAEGRHSAGGAAAGCGGGTLTGGYTKSGGTSLIGLIGVDAHAPPPGSAYVSKALKQRSTPTGPPLTMGRGTQAL